jgi:hypothetical protein
MLPHRSRGGWAGGPQPTVAGDEPPAVGARSGWWVGLTVVCLPVPAERSATPRPASPLRSSLRSGTRVASRRPCGRAFRAAGPGAEHKEPGRHRAREEAAAMAVAGERHLMTAKAALWLSARGLGGLRSPRGRLERLGRPAVTSRAAGVAPGARPERRAAVPPQGGGRLAHQTSTTSGPGNQPRGHRAPKEGTTCPTLTSPSPATSPQTPN